ncbi:Glutathione S-transferase GST-6.0 [compost metagenome]
MKALIKEKLFKRFAVLNQTLERQDYLMAGGFSIADAYLFTVLRWARLFDIELNEWPALARFQARVDQRPAVKAALDAELA